VTINRQELVPDLACIVIATLALGGPSPAVGQASVLRGSLPSGPYAVGFRTLFERDSSRGWLVRDRGRTVPDPGRPIRISLWYPAIPTTGTSMRYGDYFHYDGPLTFRVLDDSLERTDRQSWIADLIDVSSSGRDLAARLFETSVGARRDAEVARGPFPLLLYAGGLGSRADANEELGEFLASQGYIVATVPQLGPSSVDLDLGGSPAEVLLHVQDLEFAMRALRTLPGVDPGPVAIAGHSAGGIVALEFAMRNAGVAAVVGLDGSYGMHGERVQPRGPEEGFPYFAPERVTASLLDLRRANGVQGATLDTTVVADLRWANRYVVTFSRMYHGDFTEFAPIALKLNVPLPPNPDGRTRQTGYDGNQAAYRGILYFLDATLRHHPGRLEAMSTTLLRVPGTALVHKPPMHPAH